MTARPRPGRRSRRRGSTLVETAIVLNVVLMLLLGICEYGRLIMVKQLMDNAAREGARLAVVNTGSATVMKADIQQSVTNYLAGQQSSYANLNIQVGQADPASGAITGGTGEAWKAVPFGGGIGVQVDLDFKPAVPLTFGLPSAVHLTARSVMRSEAN